MFPTHALPASPSIVSFVLMLAFVWGAAWGSFMGMFVYRWPRELSIVRPGSTCPACGTAIPWYWNLPVLGFLLLRGRAACCGARLSPHYLVVETLVGVLSMAVAKQLLMPDVSLWGGFGSDTFPLGWPAAGDLDLPSTLAAAHSSVPTIDLSPRALIAFASTFAFFAALVGITFIDFRWMLIPDVLSLSSLALGLVTVSFRAIDPYDAALGAGLGYFIVYVPFVWMYESISGRRGMGEGDGKLLMAVGAFFGWRAVLFSLGAGSIQGVLFYLGSRGWRKSGPDVAQTESGEAKKAMMPFGPMLALAAMEYFFFGPALIDAYLSWIRP